MRIRIWNKGSDLTIRGWSWLNNAPDLTIRGWSWLNDAQFCRASARTYDDLGFRLPNNGFRLTRRLK